MTVPDAVVTVAVALLGGGGSAILLKIITRRQDQAKLAADTRKVVAEAASIESESWSGLLTRYREEVADLRREIQEVRGDYDTLDDHVETLEILMRDAGLKVPDRPKRKAI